MRAIVFTEVGGPEVMQLSEVPRPEVRPGMVLLKVHAIGVNFADTRFRQGTYVVKPKLPDTPGMEAAGVIEAVGDAVTDLKPGDRVIAAGTRFADGYPVSPGRASHCAHLVARRAEVARLGPDADLAGAALFVMAAVGRHGTRLANVRAGERVLVIGQGMIGQMSAQAARLRGARVIATDLVQDRVDRSAHYSADRAALVSGEELTALVHEEAPDGMDVVVDTTGNSRRFDTCLALIRREGHLLLQGYYPDPIVIDFHRAHLQRVTVVFPCGWDREDDQALADDLSRGVPTISPLITHRVPYREAPAAYRLVVEHPERCLGMVLQWSEP